MTGVAVHDTLVEIGIKPDIKWVNDVLVNERKICGILAETVDTNLGLAIVDGVGINLKSTAFPIEIAETATSIENETGTIFLPNEVSEVLTRYFNYFYDIFSGNDGPAEIIQHWRRRSTYFSGKAVLVTLAEGAIEGTTDGLEENGALRVKTSDGTVKVVQAGDVERIRRHTH
jgi:BirA family biotin operon repressor/biotin-[acetyl-CoA-carboxylase] ligase